jgi:hypothetical protein
MQKKMNNKMYLHEVTQSVGLVLEDDYDIVLNQLNIESE